MKQNIVNQPKYEQPVSDGQAWLRTPGAPDVKQALPYIAYSNMADAWLIGAWAAYNGDTVAAQPIDSPNFGS